MNKPRYMKFLPNVKMKIFNTWYNFQTILNRFELPIAMRIFLNVVNN